MPMLSILKKRAKSAVTPRSRRQQQADGDGQRRNSRSLDRTDNDRNNDNDDHQNTNDNTNTNTIGVANDEGSTSSTSTADRSNSKSRRSKMRRGFSKNSQAFSSSSSSSSSSGSSAASSASLSADEPWDQRSESSAQHKKDRKEQKQQHKRGADKRKNATDSDMLHVSANDRKRAETSEVATHQTSAVTTLDNDDLNDGELPSLSPSIRKQRPISPPLGGRVVNGQVTTVKPINPPSTAGLRGVASSSTNIRQQKQFWDQLEADEDVDDPGALRNARKRASDDEEEEDDDDDDDGDDDGPDDEVAARKGVRSSSSDEYEDDSATRDGSQSARKTRNRLAPDHQISAQEAMEEDLEGQTFCGQTLTALGDICGGFGSGPPTNSPPRKRVVNPAVQQARLRVGKAKEGENAEESTAIEVEFVEPTAHLSPERKKAYLAALALKAKQDFDQLKGATDDESLSLADSETTEEDLYNDFTPAEKSVFVKLINEGVPTSEASRRIIENRRTATKFGTDSKNTSSDASSPYSNQAALSLYRRGKNGSESDSSDQYAESKKLSSQKRNRFAAFWKSGAFKGKSDKRITAAIPGIQRVAGATSPIPLQDSESQAGKGKAMLEPETSESGPVESLETLEAVPGASSMISELSDELPSSVQEKVPATLRPTISPIPETSDTYTNHGEDGFAKSGISYYDGTRREASSTDNTYEETDEEQQQRQQQVTQRRNRELRLNGFKSLTPRSMRFSELKEARSASVPPLIRREKENDLMQIEQEDEEIQSPIAGTLYTTKADSDSVPVAVASEAVQSTRIKNVFPPRTLSAEDRKALAEIEETLLRPALRTVAPEESMSSLSPTTYATSSSDKDTSNAVVAKVEALSSLSSNTYGYASTASESLARNNVADTKQAPVPYNEHWSTKNGTRRNDLAPVATNTSANRSTSRNEYNEVSKMNSIAELDKTVAATIMKTETSVEAGRTTSPTPSVPITRTSLIEHNSRETKSMDKARTATATAMTLESSMLSTRPINGNANKDSKLPVTGSSDMKPTATSEDAMFEVEGPDMDIETYLSTSQAYNFSGSLNDTASVFSTNTGVTGVSSYTHSSRVRRPGAAKRRLEKAKQYEAEHKRKGWKESIQAMAASTKRIWDPKHGWVDYEEPETDANTVDKSDEKIRIELKAAQRKRDGYQESNNSNDEDKVYIPFPADWEMDRSEMLQEEVPATSNAENNSAKAITTSEEKSRMLKASTFIKSVHKNEGDDTESIENSSTESKDMNEDVNETSAADSSSNQENMVIATGALPAILNNLPRTKDAKPEQDSTTESAIQDKSLTMTNDFLVAQSSEIELDSILQDIYSLDKLEIADDNTRKRTDAAIPKNNAPDVVSSSTGTSNLTKPTIVKESHDSRAFPLTSDVSDVSKSASSHQNSRGWIESMKVASAAVAKDGRVWDPEHGWRTIGDSYEDEESVPNVIDFDEEQQPSAYTTTTAKEELGSPTRSVFSQTVSTISDTIDRNIPNKPSSRLDNTKANQAPSAKQGVVTRAAIEDSKSNILRSPGSSNADVESSVRGRTEIAPRSTNNAVSQTLTPSTVPAKTRNARTESKVHHHQQTSTLTKADTDSKSDKERPKSRSDGYNAGRPSDKAVPNPITDNELVETRLNTEGGENNKLGNHKFGKEVVYSSRLNGESQDESTNLVVDTLDHMRKVQTLSHSNDRPLSPIVGVVKERVSIEDMDLFVHANIDKPGNKSGASVGSNPGPAIDLNARVGSVIAAITEKSKQHEKSISPKRRTLGPIDIDEIDDASSSSSDEEEEKIETTLWDVQPYPRVDGARSFDASRSSGSNVSPSSRPIPKLLTSKKDTSPIRERHVQPLRFVTPPSDSKAVHVTKEKVENQAETFDVDEESVDNGVTPVDATASVVREEKNCRSTTPTKSRRPSAVSSPSVKTKLDYWEHRSSQPVQSDPSWPSISELPTKDEQPNTASASWRSFLNKKASAENDAAVQSSAPRVITPRRRMDDLYNNSNRIDTSMDGGDSMFGSFDIASDEDQSRKGTSPEEQFKSTSRTDKVAIKKAVSIDSDDDDRQPSEVYGSEAYGPSEDDRKSFFKRLAECAAPVMPSQSCSADRFQGANLSFLRGMDQNKDGMRAQYGPKNFCVRPDVIEETSEVDYSEQSDVSSVVNKARQLSERTASDSRRSKSAPRSRVADRKDRNETRRPRSVISEDFGAKTAYLEAIAMKAAVSKPRRSSSTSRRGQPSGSSVVSSSSSHHSEKWKAFLDKKKGRTTDANAVQKGSKSNASDVSSRAAAERYTATQVEEMMSRLNSRSGQKGAVAGEGNINNSESFTSRSDIKIRSSLSSMQSDHAAKDLAAARVNAMMEALSNGGRASNEKEI